MSLKSQTWDTQLKVPSGELLLRIFRSSKNLSTLAGFQPANLESRGEQVTPRPLVGLLVKIWKACDLSDRWVCGDEYLTKIHTCILELHFTQRRAIEKCNKKTIVQLLNNAMGILY
jgi:hypothetical protein